MPRRCGPTGRFRSGPVNASLTLKRQVDTIIPVIGDSDLVPAAWLARREGVEFILDSMRQQVGDELFEHVDGLVPVLRHDSLRQDEDQPDG